MIQTLRVASLTFLLLMPAVGHTADTVATLHAHGARHLPYWDRVAPAGKLAVIQPDAKLVDYMVRCNRLEGFATAPRAAGSDPVLEAAIAEAVATLPPPVTALIKGCTRAIVLTRELGSSAGTETILGKDGQPAACFIMLDLGALNKKANEWLTWKENTPFRPDPQVKLDATIETPAENTLARAIQYILLHEFGHVLGVLSKLHPFWEQPAPEDLQLFPFTRISWTSAVGQYFSRVDDTFTERRQIRYYHQDESTISAAAAVAVYKQLQQTSFPTLHSTKDPYDDFAESFASYVHCVLQGRQYSVRISVERIEALTYTVDWKAPRLSAKANYIKSICE
jgi:hypothetical protein